MALVTVVDTARFLSYSLNTFHEVESLLRSSFFDLYTRCESSRVKNGYLRRAHVYPETQFAFNFDERVNKRRLPKK